MATKVFTRSVWYEPEQLGTAQHSALCEQLQISAMPGTFYVPIVREYPTQEEFPRAKEDLLKRMLFAGYPHSSTNVRANGNQLRHTVGRGIYRRAASMQYNGDARTPSGSTAVVLSEIRDRGKAMSISLSHLTSLEDPDVPMFDPVMVVTDTWFQTLKDIQFLFFTAYAHFNGAPRDWYTRCTFYSVITPCEGCDTRIHLFPETITNARTVRLKPKTYPLDRVLFTITSGAQLASVSSILFADDPIWTVSEDIFELMCPIWWSRLQYKIPETFEAIDRQPMAGPYQLHHKYRLLASDDDHHTSVLSASWVVNRSKNGIFYGYTYDKDTGLLEYGIYLSGMSGKVHSATLLGVVDIKEVPGEPILDSDIVFRPGFKPNIPPTTTVKTPVSDTVEEVPATKESTATASDDDDHHTSVLPQEDSETVSDVVPSEEETPTETNASEEFQTDNQNGEEWSGIHEKLEFIPFANRPGEAITMSIPTCRKSSAEPQQQSADMQWPVPDEGEEEDGAAIVSSS